MATAHPHRHASGYVRAPRLLRGFRGWAYWITRSLDRENIPRGWQRVCGSTFLKGPSRILGAGTVSCLRVYLTQPRVRTTTTTTTTTRQSRLASALLPRLSELKMHREGNFVMTGAATFFAGADTWRKWNIWDAHLEDAFASRSFSTRRGTNDSLRW